MADSILLRMNSQLIRRLSKPKSSKLTGINGSKPGVVNGYLPDGTFPHGKSTKGLSQWLMRPSEAVPIPAFGMHPDLVRRLFAFVNTAPFGETGIRIITDFADSEFCSCWSEVRSRFVAAASAARRKIVRKEVERVRIGKQLEDCPEHIPEEAPRLEMAHGPLARAAFGGWLALWLALCFFTVFNCRSLLVLVLQDNVRAVCFALPLLLLPIGLKLALDRWAQAAEFMKSPWVALLLALAGALFAFEIGQTFGRSRSIDEIADTSTVGRDWRYLMWASLGLEILAGSLIYQHLCAYVVRRQYQRRNPEYDRILSRAATLDEAVNLEAAAVARNEGLMEEWETSRAAFIEVGLAYHRLLAERQRIAEENVTHIETLHRLWLPKEGADYPGD